MSDTKYIEVGDPGSEVYLEVAEEHHDHYRAFPLGGGFQRKIHKDQARIVEPKSNWQEVKVGFDEPPWIPALVDLNYRWNGWLDPFFEKDVIMSYLQDIGAKVLEETEKRIIIDVGSDCTDELNLIEVQGRHLWNLNGWCWVQEPDETD